jgi:hypothetical protein
MFQRKYLVFLAATFLLALLWTGGWFWLANKLRTDIDNFVVQERTNGVNLEWDRLRISGFPIRFDTTFTSPRGELTNDEQIILWTGADTAIRPFAEGAGIVSFRAPGEHRFERRFQQRDKAVAGSLVTRSEDFQGRVEFDNSGRLRGLRGQAEPLQLSLDNGPNIAIARAAFNWSNATIPGGTDALHPDPLGQSVAMIVTGIDLTALPLDRDVVKTLGPTIENLSGRLALRGQLNPTRITAENLAQWRDAGGTLEVENLELRWGSLRFAGSGTLSVDDKLQPVGAFSARVSGLNQLIEMLEQRGQIGPQQAAIARIAVAVLTRNPANGGPPEAKVPVTIQDRVVSIGPVPLLKFDPVNWD